MFRIATGAARSPVILHVPHGSRHISPVDRRRLRLDDAALAAELDRMTDAHTGWIAARARSAAGQTPWALENLTSRLVVDPERFPDEREEMNAVGMGAVYTRTSYGQTLREPDPALLAEYYEPYAAAIAGLVSERLAATGRAVILDVHSYPSAPLPYELHGTDHRPEICLGVDAFHTPESLLDAASRAFDDFEIGVNSPFSGAYVPLAHYRIEPSVTALMIEIRRDTYMIEPGGPVTAGAGRIAAALVRLLDMM